jgi:hypothetical protein
MKVWGGFIGIFLLTATVFAAEPGSSSDDNKISLSQAVLNDVFFQPTIRAIEDGKGGIDPLQWAIGAKTNFASWVDVVGSIGASQLLYRPFWTQSQTTGPVVLVDFVGTLHTLLGDVYAGQTLVPWGLQGQTKESQLWLPRDLFYENGAFPLRDVGVGLRSELNGVYMNVMAHNGEGADLGDQDNRMFLTAQWGLLGSANTNLGLSLTAGRVAQPLVPNELHVRGGNVFFGFNVFGLGLQLEGSYIQYISDPQTVDTFAYHADLEHPITSNINFIGRFEQYNPNTRVTSNILGRAYVGGEYHSKNNSSRLFLFAINNSETQNPYPSNEIRLTWRISPPTE